MFQTVGDAAVKRDTSKKNAPQRRSVHLKIDVPLLVVSVTLGIIGLLMVYSASWDYSFQLFGSSTYIFQRQVLWLALGMLVAMILVFFDYRIYRTFAVPLILITVASLVLVLIMSDVRNNAVRTLFGGSIQPSELAKLIMIIYLAVWLFSKRDQLSDVSFGLIPLAGILGVVGGLIFIQPDLSAVITIFMMGGIMFFLAGGDLKQIGFLILLALLFGWVIVALNSTGSDRVSSYLAGLRDPFQASYHVRRSLEAFVKGGWFGAGIGNSETKLTGLPVPPTDSIFAVIGEETGVLGAIVLVILYSVLLWRGLGIARRAPDGLGTLLAAGLSIWLAMEAMINMAVMVGLLPFAGNALPFISAGGSNLMVSCIAIGILLNISRLSVKTKEEEAKGLGAVVDLRRWDRRRRVSRPRRARRSEG
jgi:cell division protein FtsW